MNRKFQAYAIGLFLLVVILSLYFSGGGINKGVSDFEECVSAGNPVMKSYPAKCEHNGVIYVEDIGSEIEIYFRNELYEQAVENAGGMPIEGFNPGLYKIAYPGIEYEDFDNALAIGGIWKFQNNELIWIAETNEYITSADGTLNDKGLNVLLENLETRLGVVAQTEVDVDNIISILSIHKCGEEERNVGACITLYDPVCGWNDAEKIQCIKYPCAQDYSNGCEACNNVEVSYWTPGMCPA
jgi:hypothetical protein